LECASERLKCYLERKTDHGALEIAVMVSGSLQYE